MRSLPPMRLALLVSFLLILGACATVEPIEITIENVDDETRLIPAYDEPQLTILEQHGGDWQGVASSIAMICLSRCGDLGGATICADVAAPDGVWALLPGDSTSIVVEGEHWVSRPNGPMGSCAARTALAGEVQLSICHGTQAETWEGVAIAEPTESGLIGGQGEGVQLVDAVCDRFEVDLAQGRSVTVQLEGE